MRTRGERFAGLTVALVTPFRGDAVDWDGLRRLVDFHVESGTDCLAPVGTTGESPTLTHDEHERVVETVVERAAGRLRVMAGTGSNSTAEAVRLTKAAKKAGADGALVVSPYYNRPSQEGLYRHFAKIAEATDLPLVLYNIPIRTGRNVEPSTIARLAADLPSLVAVKEASGVLDQSSELVATTDLTVLAGDDSLTLPVLSVGGRGVVSVAGNLVPREMRAVVQAFEAGRTGEAAELHRRLFPLLRTLMSLAPNPTPVKAAMKLLGRGSGEVRLPLCPLDAAEEAKLAAELERFGLRASC